MKVVRWRWLPGRRRSGPKAQVEMFSDSEVLGWLDVRAGSPPVRVGLYLDEVEATATWAIDVAKRSVIRERREFRLALRDVWRFCEAATQLSVRIDGTPIEIAGHGLFRTAPRAGKASPTRLAKRLADGYVFGQFGRLQLSKTRDLEWQRTVMDLHERIHEVVRDDFGYDTFFCYGTLLGAVRENGFIGHDLDFDAAYVSKFSDGAMAAAELKSVALRLVEAGFNVMCKRTALHIYSDAVPAVRVDLFHLYFDNNGRLQFPFGIAGETEILKENWSGVDEMPFAGGTGHLPRDAEAIAEHIYGAHWRVPKPGFKWELDRTTRAPEESIMPVDFGIEVFWENFYARNAIVEPSPFARELVERPDLPRTVLDLGCGNGRDSLLFAREGRLVVGIDRSQYGLTQARERAGEAPVEAVFYRRDLRDADALDGIDLPRDPVLFYARFLLQALEVPAQDQVISSLGAKARPDDLLALEFRTEPSSTWRYGRHYRRPVEGAEVSAQLEQAGWSILDLKSGTGLAQHEQEDPSVLRLVARRSG